MYLPSGRRHFYNPAHQRYKAQMSGILFLSPFRVRLST